MADRFLTIEDLGNLPPPKWLIEGLFEQTSLAMLVGPPGAFKSFLALDWGMCLATGRRWNGRAVEPSRVLYALGEGKASLLKRLKAWIWHNQLNSDELAKLNANFRITFDVPQLVSPRDVGHFITDLDEDGFNPTVFFVDTLARSFVGKDENSQLDAGLWIDGADRLRQKGMAVIALHHTKKNLEFGLQYRGSSSLRGGMDTELTLHRDPEGMRGTAKLTCTKQKEHEEFSDIWMRREHVRPPDNEQGSIVLTEFERSVKDIQEDYQDQEMEIDAMIKDLMENLEYESDRARARDLAAKTGMLEGTAQSRISRARRKNG